MTPKNHPTNPLLLRIIRKHKVKHKTSQKNINIPLITKNTPLQLPAIRYLYSNKIRAIRVIRGPNHAKTHSTHSPPPPPCLLQVCPKPRSQGKNSPEQRLVLFQIRQHPTGRCPHLRCSTSTERYTGRQTCRCPTNRSPAGRSRCSGSQTLDSALRKCLHQKPCPTPPAPRGAARQRLPFCTGRLYQSRWRPELPMVHLLPHWNWPGREGQPTPVHVFTSGDEVELFLNGQSLGRQQKEPYEYRLRWDELRYTPGELKAVAYKNGAPWAETRVVTTGAPTALQARADRSTLQAEASDLAFVSVEVCDADGNTVPNAHPLLTFSLEGPGEIVATDNGDPSDMTAFPSLQRKAFNGKCLVIIRPQKGKPGTLQLTVSAKDLESATVRLQSE